VADGGDSGREPAHEADAHATGGSQRGSARKTTKKAAKKRGGAADAPRAELAADAVSEQVVDAEVENGSTIDSPAVGRSQAASPSPRKQRPRRAAQRKAMVTVLVPSYRHERYIERTIESVLAQRGVDFDLLVVDDRSPDRTVERARRYETDPRVTVSCNDTNLGLGNSVLAALEQVRTPYVALLNSDDLFHPDRLKRSLDALTSNPGAEVVTTGLYLVDHRDREITPEASSRLVDGREIHEWVQWYTGAQPPRDDEDGLFRRLLRGNFLATSSNLVCTRSFLLEHAESLRSLKYTLDWTLFLDAARRGTLVHVPDRLVAYRLHRTNTVWFREGRRWTYYVEVNRVAAEAVRASLDETGTDASGRLALLRVIAEDLQANPEIHGLALFANLLFGGVVLDALSGDERAAAQLRELAENGARQARLGYLADEHGEKLERRLHDSYEIPSLQVHKVLADVDDSEVSSLRSVMANEAQRALEDAARIEGLARQADAAERRVREVESAREAAARRADDFMHRLFGLGARLKERAVALGEAEPVGRGAMPDELPPDTHPEDLSDILQAAALAIVAEGRRRAQERDGARAALQGARAWAAWLQDRLGEERAEAARIGERVAEVEADLGTVRGELTTTRTRLAELETELHETKRHFDVVEAERLAEIDRLSAELETTSTALVATERRESDAREEIGRLWHEMGERAATHQREMDALLASRPYRFGRFVSELPGVGKTSRFARKTLRTTRHLRDRTVSFFQRLFGRKRERRKAVVAACFDFPIYSHTFVYQEMIGLRDAGFDVEVFCWRLNDTSKMHSAFSYLLDNCRVIESEWERHVEDRDYWKRKEPQKVAALLERLSSEMGLSVEKLENDYEILMGFTFAREAEQAGANYLHTYFFYEESFFALVTSALLDIPRGVSCYADHMMQDSRFKTMSLQMDTADIVVATSRRIKQELIGLTDERFAERIIVKPNGVDGRRFPFTKRPALDDAIELLSVSRIEPKKGFLELCAAVKKLEDAGRKVRVHVVGTPDAATQGGASYGERFEAERKRLGIEDSFVMHGFKKQEELAPIIARCHAFVAPYVEVENGDKDGIPTAILEAMSSGLGVLCTDAGSITEVIDDQVEGLVVKQRDSDAMAAAIGKLFDDPKLIERFSAAARTRFDKEFDARVTDAKLHARIEQVFGSRIASTVG
jgi:colanic acid/amylovoran biosynthesis glycosyltransferase